MEENRKSIPWYWWPVAGLVLLGVYLLSFGPLFYFARRGAIPGWLLWPLSTLYAPLEWIQTGPIPVRDAFQEYLKWWTP